MATSRRNFLKRGTLVALAAGVPAGLVETAIAKETENKAPTSYGLTKSVFQAQLNTNFMINEGASKVEVKLVKVGDLPHRGVVGPGKEAFSLRFRGDLAVPLKQNTYLFQHEKLGLFSFLLVPIKTRDSRSQYYEAIINRLYP